MWQYKVVISRLRGGFYHESEVSLSFSSVQCRLYQTEFSFHKNKNKSWVGVSKAHKNLILRTHVKKIWA